MEMSQSLPKARVQIAHPAVAMLGLMIGSFVGMFSETALNIALPSLMASLHVTQGTVQCWSQATCWSSGSACRYPAC